MQRIFKRHTNAQAMKQTSFAVACWTGGCSRRTITENGVARALKLTHPDKYDKVENHLEIAFDRS